MTFDFARFSFDSEFNEADHPRAPDGKFGNGSGGKVNPQDLKKVGGKMGSNEGGTYESKTGEKYYVKKPKSKAHVANEIAAARLYKLAGVNTLNYVDAGDEHVATKLEKLDKKNIKDFTPSERKEAAKDFAIHAWLSNWDAAGLGGDNQGVLNGKVTTLDVGGSLKYRAQGSDKGAAFGDKVTEMKSLRDKGMNPDAASLFGRMTDQEIAESVKRVTSIKDDDIRAAVGDDKALADRLIARKKDLAETYGGMAKDEMMLAFDRALDGNLRPEGLAFDRASVRTYSVDGHLHVEATPISKANVCPYLGSEIPDCELLGLDKKKIYKLLRDPSELEKAAATFNNLPLLRKHVPISASDHKFDDVVGSTGTDAAFVYPYLMNSLVVWSKDDITGVETGKKRELSSAYRYTADMTPGVHDGAPYDGVMRNIVGNHVALVSEGRAGADVLVGDSINPSIQEMLKMSKALSRKAVLAQGALAVYLQPKLAADQKIDLMSVLSGVSSNNFRSRMGAIASRIEKITNGKLAMDAKLDDLPSLLLALDGVEVEEVEEKAKDKKKLPAIDADIDEEEEEEAEDEEMEEEEAEDSAEEEEAEEEAEKPLPNKDKKKAKDKWPKAKDRKAKDEDDGEEGMDKKAKDRKAMDEAISFAVDEAIKGERSKQQAIFKAREKVRLLVGDLPALAFDSAEGVYRHTIKAVSGKDVSKVRDLLALEAMVDFLPRPGHRDDSNVIAMDSAQSKSFADRFPGASKVVIG